MGESEAGAVLPMEQISFLYSSTLSLIPFHHFVYQEHRGQIDLGSREKLMALPSTQFSPFDVWKLHFSRPFQKTFPFEAQIIININWSGKAQRCCLKMHIHPVGD